MVAGSTDRHAYRTSERSVADSACTYNTLHLFVYMVHTDTKPFMVTVKNCIHTHAYHTRLS